MPMRWTKTEEKQKRKELLNLYVKENKTIGEIGKILGISESTVYDRLLRLGISPTRFKKPKYNNQNLNIIIPKKYSQDLAEFIGILLGDGHLTPTQVTVTLGTKENDYAQYVVGLMEKLFGVKPKFVYTKRGDGVIYLGSTKIVKWLISMGLAHNKVKSQVNIPSWCFSEKEFMKKILRGLIDTDGSVYKLRFGIQLSFCNRSHPLLQATRSMLLRLGFNPSRITGYNIYLTRKEDILKYVEEIGFKNKKHLKRFVEFNHLKWAVG